MKDADWLLPLGLLAIILYLWQPDWLVRLWYKTNGVDYANVQIYARPTDCDFLTAPIGKKGCHYERKVTPWQLPDGTHMINIYWDKVLP